MADVIQRVAAEIRELSRGATDLDLALGDLVRVCPSKPEAHNRQLQYGDVLCQSLICLTEFLELMALETEPGWRIDLRAATAAITLRDIAERLGNPGENSKNSSFASNGDCTLL